MEELFWSGGKHTHTDPCIELRYAQLITTEFHDDKRYVGMYVVYKSELIEEMGGGSVPRLEGQSASLHCAGTRRANKVQSLSVNV